MRLSELLRHVLLEAMGGREIHQKYFKDIPYHDYVRIILADPKSFMRGDDIVKVGKYAKILLHLYRQKALLMEDLPKAKEYLGYAYNHNVRLDQSKIHNIGDIYTSVARYLPRESRSFESVKRMLNPVEYDHVFSGKVWDIYVPKTERAACYLGVNTEWCTSYGHYSLNPEHTEHTNQFENYSKKDPLYILINKKDNNLKYQFHFGSNQFMDAGDRGIGIQKFFETNTELISFFFPSVNEPNATPEEIAADLKKSKALPVNFRNKLVQRLIKFGGVPFVSAIHSGDEIEMKKFVTDERVTDISIRDNHVIFEVPDDYDFEDIRLCENYMQATFYDDSISMYWDGTEYPEEQFDEMFEKFMEERGRELQVQYAESELSSFKTDKLKEQFEETFIMEWAGKAYDHISEACREMNRRWDAVIELDSYRSSNRLVEVKLDYISIIEFVIINGVREIDNYADFVGDYLDYFDIPNNSTSVWDELYEKIAEVDIPDYDKMKGVFETYFETEFDLDDTKYIAQRDAYIEKLHDYYERFGFNDDLIFSNQYVRVQIVSGSVDYRKGTIGIIFTNKKTGKTEHGTIRIDNLPRFVTNHPLYERKS
jgi:hypothetical protein